MSDHERWQDLWHRRGELLTVASLAALLTSIASGAWVQIVAAFAVILLGVYIIVAVDAGWWLPGRRERSKFRPHGGTDVLPIVLELNQLNKLLAARLSPPQQPEERTGTSGAEKNP